MFGHYLYAGAYHFSKVKKSFNLELASIVSICCN